MSIASSGSSAWRRSSRPFRPSCPALNRQDDSRVCVLTPGPLNETYFEHAYLARYLGFLLVEGEDLTVRDDGVFIRTVSGLKRAEVLVRRLDADFADPLELNARSRLGVPGLVQAVRDGTVVIANALGSGVVEARAMSSFLPALAPAVLGSELALPNVATWWLGQARARNEIIERLDEMVIASAFSGELPGYGERREVLGAALDRRRASEDPRRRSRHRGIDFVAQEAVTLSTTPVWRNGRLEPRPFTLRLFLARTADGWRVMPGGFVRVADDVDARAVSLQRGGRTGDAWVLSDKPVAETTLLPAPDRITISRATGALPSRAADNLFWVARYVERAEATLRLVRALVNRAGDSDEAATRVVARIRALLGDWEAVPTDLPNAKPVLVAAAALQNRDLDGAMPYLVGAAQSAASVIRDRFSPDAWRALTDLFELINAPIGSPGRPKARSSSASIAALRIIASFSGLAQENMSQLAGWRFLELGRRIERAIATCRFVEQFAFTKPTARSTSCWSSPTARSPTGCVTSWWRRRAPVIDLVVLDPSNPRSVAYQLGRIEAHLSALPPRSDDGRLSPPEQIATSLATQFRTADAAALDLATFRRTEGALMKLADVIASTYFTTHERAEVRWEALG